MNKKVIDTKKQTMSVVRKNAMNKSVDSERGDILGILVTLASAGTRFRIVGVDCEELPFIGDDFVARCDTDIFRNEKEAKVYIEGLARGLLRSMGLDASIEVSSKVAVKKHEFIPYVNSGKFLNLYIDIGSTNSKWMVVRAQNEKGGNTGFLEISSPAETKRICDEWGFTYNKASAYSLDDDGFAEWMGLAAYAVMMHFRNKYNADIVDMRWAFPRIVHDRQIDFRYIGKHVSSYLKKRGLRGDFEVCAESDALNGFFFDRLKDLALASDNEEKENKRREDLANANKRYNIEEKAKEKRSKEQRAVEAFAWKREHWIKNFLGFNPEYKTALYQAKCKDESWVQSELMKAFRITGARADGKFNLLILDAGGSTLDYFYRSADGQSVSSGSYRAGGQDVTAVLKEMWDVDFEVAESRKKNLSTSSIDSVTQNGPLFDASSEVYKEQLEEIANRIYGEDVVTEAGKFQLCVVGTGLAMANPQLQLLIKEVFKLKKEQSVIWSPGIVNALSPEQLKAMSHEFEEFASIVRRKDANTDSVTVAWPSSDVVGGLYFVSRAK